MPYGGGSSRSKYRLIPLILHGFHKTGPRAASGIAESIQGCSWVSPCALSHFAPYKKQSGKLRAII